MKRRLIINLPEIKDGEILLTGMYYSVDPYMRGRMNDTKSYVPPFEIDKHIPTCKFQERCGLLLLTVCNLLQASKN